MHQPRSLFSRSPQFGEDVKCVKYKSTQDADVERFTASKERKQVENEEFYLEKAEKASVFVSTL